MDKSRKRQLSDLMREGAKLRPQAFGRYYEHGGTCAIGAVLEALLGSPPSPLMPDDQVDQIIQDATGVDLFNTCYHPKSRTSLFWMIANLNDKGMSREEIAERLERDYHL